MIFLIIVVTISFSLKKENGYYHNFYFASIADFNKQQLVLSDKINKTNIFSPKEINDIKESIEQARLKLKAIDFWLRYLDPVAYKKINGPLPVEWENEVFEKFEKPYKRKGAGLSLAELYLNKKSINKDSLLHLINLSINEVKAFSADSITKQLDTFDHFFLCNRLYLLNLAAIYTTGFECPDSKNIIPELSSMCTGVKMIYLNYNQTFPDKPITKEYIELYDKTIDFVGRQPSDFKQFDHFTFIKEFVNPLFAINQKLIIQYDVLSKNNNDYTLNNAANSIFDKSLYTSQNTKGIYSLVNDKEALIEIKETGKKLFYDPILSGNNLRSCASCHKPTEYFTDTSFASSLQFDRKKRLKRNTPTLVNVVYNHLLMQDGKHISLQNQAKDVMTNPDEMGGNEKEIIAKVLSCKEYKAAFKKFLKLTPEEKEVTFEHIASAITYYYSDYSSYYSPFDEAMNNNKPLSEETVNGFNLFMGKAQCATCHYVPQFTGVPPPYIGSEFEVLGVPEDTAYTQLSEDKGRYKINPAIETMYAFRTGTIRNIEHTKPYMHNGVFNSLNQVIDFYDSGGGEGKKMKVDNQTLSPDSLRLSPFEKKELISFIHSLNENIIFEQAPEQLPISSHKELDTRKVGGVY